MLALKKNSRGFTLIETAISLIIAGLILAPLLVIYNNYQVEKKKRTTYANVYSAVDVLHNYRQVNGHFPCPSPMNVPRTDPAYGREGDCTVDGFAPDGVTAGDLAPSSLALGACGDGFCVERSVRAGLINNRVIVGMIPFRAMQLEEDYASDAYNGRLIYAVTESLTNVDTVNDNNGAIAIRDLEGDPLTDPDGSAGFIILSHGPGQKGAYNNTGTLTQACDAGTADAENCNEGFETGTTGDAIYTSAFRSDAAGASFYDDTALFYSQNMEPMWKRTTDDEESIEDLSLQFTGIGVDAPTTQLDISSATAGTDSLGVHGTSGTDGRILIDQICDENGLNCFNPNIIGGTIADGLGMDCPNANEYMIGIENGAPRCAPIAVTCPDSTPILIGRNGDGSPRCSSAPACGARSFSVCGTDDISLATAAEGFSQTAELGACRRVRFRCTSGGWTVTDRVPPGQCVFTSTDTNVPGIDCPWPYTGTYTETRRTLCLGGYEVIADTIADDCVCNVPNVTTRWVDGGNCPDGYAPNPVGIQVEQTFNATACQWEDTNQTNDCTCVVPDVTSGWGPDGSCPSGFAPNPNGPMREWQFNTGSCEWQPTSNTTNDCACDTSPQFEDEPHTCDNPVCEEPRSDRPDRYRIDIDSSTCTPQPRVPIETGQCQPKTFEWADLGSTGNPAPAWPPSGGAIYIEESCSCAARTAATTRTCFLGSDTNHIMHTCRCQ